MLECCVTEFTSKPRGFTEVHGDAVKQQFKKSLSISRNPADAPVHYRARLLISNF